MDESWIAELDDPLWLDDGALDAVLLPFDADDVVLPGRVGKSEGGQSLDRNAMDQEEGESEDVALPRPCASTPLLERQRAYRAKKKAERELLRATAKRLEGDVSKLEAEAAASASAMNNCLVVGWKGVALRQKQRRTQAEALNRQLRSLVRRHHAVALHFTDALQAVGAASPPLSHFHIQKPVMAFNEADKRVINTFRLELEAMRAVTDSVLSSCEMPTLSPEAEYGFRCGRRWDEAANCEVVEIAETHGIPFAFPEAVTALYKALPSMFAKECEPALLSLPGSPYAVAVKFSFSGLNDQAQQQKPVEYECLTVTSGVDEASRCVLGWRSIVTVLGSPDISFSESSWGTAQALLDPSTGQSIGTRLDFCTRLRSTNPTSDAASALLAKYVAQVTEVAPSDAVELTQAIENVLVDEMAALSVSSNV